MFTLAIFKLFFRKGKGIMYKIISTETLAPHIKKVVVLAPKIAAKAQPGQFIILRVHEDGERIPLTIADFDSDEGTVTIIFQEVGKTTKLLGTLKTGEHILDFAGPLGVATHVAQVKKVAVVGGGLGTAIAYPQAKHLHKTGASVDVIAGFRNKDYVILEEALKAASSRLTIATDDGSYGEKGFVTDCLKKAIEAGEKYDLVIAIGPLAMMKAISELTKTYGIKTVVSMNPVMIDGTGMCGGCRLTVAGEVKFACVDGPDFDGHQVDFEEAMRRQRMYKTHEQASESAHECKRLGGIKSV